ncbi:hypothetical protein M3P05_05310 [Sansalvadorimonas sp. 2012CJ34-2]|uniref:Uncharacterized protein n=1 Tax=Parendozoicomonas callyspongiae TaxID=2942213 RepID=A0ABT0PDI1_9GAMM|nr:hypothetical protein [Sansalvadorimonas sp. 2012CJ34-2]MCL6269363.1 hypothetical protein [Sansalvadorimonas sp. 2012CJ34-2]
MYPLKVSTVNHFIDSKLNSGVTPNAGDVASFDVQGQIIVHTPRLDDDDTAYYCNLAVHKLEHNLRFLTDAADQASQGQAKSIHQREVTEDEVSGGDLLSVENLMMKSFGIRESEVGQLNDRQAELTTAIINGAEYAEVSTLARLFAEEAYAYLEKKNGEMPSSQKLGTFLKSVQDAVFQDCGDPTAATDLSKAVIASQQLALTNLTQDYDDLQKALALSKAEHQQFTKSLPSSAYSQDEELCLGSLTPSLTRQMQQSEIQTNSASPTVKTSRGKQLLREIKAAEDWKYENSDSEATEEFLKSMDQLFGDCQMYMTSLSSPYQQGQKIPDEVAKECDALSSQLVQLRNHWGQELLPNTTCNSFVREKASLNYQDKQYEVHCAQFFEPTPFYPGRDSVGEFMKLHRFSVYIQESIVCRYFLERSNAIEPYHVLCKYSGHERCQVMPFGEKEPSFWDVRQAMINDMSRNGPKKIK